MDRFSAERTVQFAHCWTSEVQETLRIRESETFTTAFGLAYYEWAVGLSRGESDFPFNRRGRRNRDVKLILEPSLRSFHVRVPTAINCLFTLALKDPETYETILYSELLMEPSQQDVDELDFIGAGGETMAFRVPEESDYGKKLNQIFSKNSTYSGYIFDISTIIKMSQSAFIIAPWTLLAPTTPIEPNALTCALYEEDRFNFSIRSSNGEEFRTRKDALNCASPFFRDFFSSDFGRNADYLMESEYSLDVIKTVVVHLLTGTFSAPPTWRPDLATQCLALATKYRSFDKKLFVRSVEKLCCEGLDKQPLDMIVKWLLVGFENELPRLQNAAIALVLTVHNIAFQINYEGPNVDNARRGTADRLNHRRGAFRPSLLSKLTHLRTGNRHVKAMEIPQ